jgi:hypothetical protein
MLGATLWAAARAGKRQANAKPAAPGGERTCLAHRFDMSLNLIDRFKNQEFNLSEYFITMQPTS